MGFLSRLSDNVPVSQPYVSRGITNIITHSPRNRPSSVHEVFTSVGFQDARCSLSQNDVLIGLSWPLEANAVIPDDVDILSLRECGKASGLLPHSSNPGESFLPPRKCLCRQRPCGNFSNPLSVNFLMPRVDAWKK